MQSKWVLQTLIRIFSTSQTESAVESLKAFLPSSMSNFESALLSPALAEVLQLLHLVIYSDKSCPESTFRVETALKSLLPKLTSKPIITYHKPCARFSTMTGFKSFLHEGHKDIVAAKLDAEAGKRAADVMSLIGKFTQHATATLSDSSGSFDFDAVLTVVKEGLKRNDKTRQT